MEFVKNKVSAAVGEAVGGSAMSDIRDIVVPIDLTQIGHFSDLIVEEKSVKRRNDLLRPLCEQGVTVVWEKGEIQPLLTADGGYAGNSNFAHGLICDSVYKAKKESFDAIGGVTLAELWPLIHVVFKKRKLVFERGFVTGIRKSLG